MPPEFKYVGTCMAEYERTSVFRKRPRISMTRLKFSVSSGLTVKSFLGHRITIRLFFACVTGARGLFQDLVGKELHEDIVRFGLSLKK